MRETRSSSSRRCSEAEARGSAHGAPLGRRQRVSARPVRRLSGLIRGRGTRPVPDRLEPLSAKYSLEVGERLQEETAQPRPPISALGGGVNT